MLYAHKLSHYYVTASRLKQTFDVGTYLIIFQRQNLVFAKQYTRSHPFSYVTNFFFQLKSDKYTHLRARLDMYGTVQPIPAHLFPSRE